MTPVHLALSRRAPESGCTGELLRQQWRAPLDLRQVARAHINGRCLGPGRAGERLGQLATLTRFVEEATAREDAALAPAS
jgi:hypothetical protein